ncbi:MAG: hypothetical protein NVS3B20_24250 [Polyangiales bacterium]
MADQRYIWLLKAAIRTQLCPHYRPHERRVAVCVTGVSTGGVGQHRLGLLLCLAASKEHAFKASLLVKEDVSP